MGSSGFLMASPYIILIVAFAGGLTWRGLHTPRVKSRSYECACGHLINRHEEEQKTESGVIVTRYKACGLRNMVAPYGEKTGQCGCLRYLGEIPPEQQGPVALDQENWTLGEYGTPLQKNGNPRGR